MLTFSHKPIVIHGRMDDQGRSASGVQGLSVVPLLRATGQEQKRRATRVISHVMGSFSVSLTHCYQ